EEIMNAKPPVAIGPRAIRRRAVAATQVNSLLAPATTAPAPEDFYIGSNQAYGITTKASLIAEPSVGNSGKNWFVTQNWTAGYSTDAGATWNSVPPLTSGTTAPTRAPIFCCDQDVIHDHGRNITFWSELFINKAKTNGVVRIFVRSADNLT